MGKDYDSVFIRNALECLAIFEKKTWLLYEDLTEKMDTPLTRSLMNCIALDSKKHSTLLKAIASNMPRKAQPPDLPKAMKDALKSIDNFQIELSKIDSMSAEELSNICVQLTCLETTLSEEYLELIEYDALQSICDALNNSHKISFESIKTLLLEAHHDEEQHKIILALASELPSLENRRIDNTPAVRFRNPDAWAPPC